VLFEIDSELGRSYVAAMELAGEYAYAGRDTAVAKALEILGAGATQEVHNHHNFAWRETHGDRELWVVRKGATPAFPGQRGFVGGSMGDDAVILEGVESEASADSLYSTVHGAGRICGRMEAKGKKNKAGEWTRQPRFTRKQMDVWLQEKRVLLRGGDVDESPMAYRRLPDVLREHDGTIRVLHTLRPFAVAMAGLGEFDPYKD
jgi:tRNA-splicing ligase RtcB